MNEQFTEILKLKDMLDEHNIPYEYEKKPRDALSALFGVGARHHIEVPNRKNLVISIIQGTGTYGAEDDLLEIMGLLTNEEAKLGQVVGWLAADDVLQRILTYYNKERLT